MSDEAPDPLKEAARKRNELWERMGCPVAPEFMHLHHYEREFRGRIRWINRAVMDSFQQTVKRIICPNCIEEVRGGFVGTPLFIRVEDDVLTVFKAMAHCLCHRCGFEEYYPMMRDPRAETQAAHESVMAQREQQMAAYNHQLQQLRAQGFGIAGALGMTDAEQRSLMNMYNGGLGGGKTATEIEIKKAEAMRRLGINKLKP